MLKPTSIACPRCKAPLFKDKYLGQDDEHFWCTRCSTDFSPAYIEACDRCSSLDCLQFSPAYIRIKPRPRSEDWKMIRLLFNKKDIRCNEGCYYIYNLPKYAHLKCVQTASWAFLHQLELA